MKVLREALLGLAVLGIALGLGLAAGLAVILVMNAVLPAFRPEDDETLRELIPAGLAYATMAGTAGLVVFIAWRRLRSRSTVEPSNGDADQGEAISG
jgi:ABC-type Fe3+-siderophore transport system permease subunit